MRFSPLAVLGLVLLAAVPSAQAAQRYASPSGTGTGCAQAVPCSLETAVAKAKENDEVIIASGSYTAHELYPEDFAVESLYVHGDFGSPMPIISSSAKTERYVLGTFGAGSVLSWVDVRASGQESGGVECAGARVERVRATESGAEGTAILAGGGCAIVDSLAVAGGGGSSALFALRHQWAAWPGR